MERYVWIERYIEIIWVRNRDKVRLIEIDRGRDRYRAGYSN